MATSLSTTFHGLAAGKTFTPGDLRAGLASRLTIIGDQGTSMRARSGILPDAGSPLKVQQRATPNMSVTVVAGSVAQQAAAATGGVYTHTLTTNGVVDIDDSNISNPRLDVIVATVFDDGVAPVTRIECLKGTPGASPTLPAALTTPPANTIYFPLAQVRVNAGVSSILASDITKPAVSAMGLTMGQYTCAPGGTLRGVTRKWTHTRNTTTIFTAGAAAGAVNQVSVAAADCYPGIYQATFHAMWQMSGTPDSATSVILMRSVTPQGTFVYPIDVRAGRFFSWVDTRTIVIDAQPGSAQVWQTTLAVGAGSLNASVGAAAYPSVLEVVRIADL